MLASCKKYYLWILLGFLILTVILIFSSFQSNFWKPRALIFNISTKFNFLQAVLDHATSKLFYLVSTIIHKQSGFNQFTCLGLTGLLIIVFHAKLAVRNFLLYNKILDSLSPNCTSEFIDYKRYFSQNIRAIIPLP